MSKIVRKKYLNIIELLSQATDVTVRLIKEEKLQDCLTLLADCQEGAVALGSHIKKLYGEETLVESVLEKYCEILYQLSVSIDEHKAVEKLCKRIVDVVKQIKIVYDSEFPEKKEVVFLPYKSSMWDSMESIWKAAKSDYNCDVVVMPLPYYDREQHGYFKQLNWEGEAFPEYVPITHYEDYDIKEHCPDVVIIHNPYDDGNRVTSIHPEYYSEKLKQYVGTIVYVPYFVIPQAPTDKERNFVLQKGVINADYIFVQNEETKRFYIDTLKAFSNHREVENKIIAIGSPKTDKIIQTEMEDSKIPHVWEEKIKEKKVLFFNTNLSLILHNSEHILEYIQHVFEVFKAHPEFVIIWREHPLTFSTLKALRPDLLDKYMELRNTFIKDDFGILDETPEPHLAMAVSDCYYGAGGSLSAVYPVTGKPLMIMDYLYPQRISDKCISLEDILSTASARLLYAERNINSLDLFLTNIDVFEAQKEERISKQSIRMNNLDGTVGEKIYQYIKEW